MGGAEYLTWRSRQCDPPRLQASAKRQNDFVHAGSTGFSHPQLWRACCGLKLRFQQMRPWVVALGRFRLWGRTIPRPRILK